MKKGTIFLAISIVAMTVLSACGNKEETKTTEKVEVTTEAAKGDEGGKKEENNKPSDEKAEFKIIETVNVFGGGTFDLNKDLEKPGNIYITEVKDDIYMTLRDNHYGTYRVVSGNKQKWQSISDEFSSDNGQYPRGYSIFKEENNELRTGWFIFDDVNYTSNTDNVVPTGDSLFLVKTSKGEGFIVGNENTYTLYGGGKPILEFKDVKDVMHMIPNQTQYPHESLVYIDMELKKLYFTEQYGDYSLTYQLDLETGEPLFENGKMKKIKSSRNVDILGDANGNLYIFETGDSVTISVYNSSLDLIAEGINIPVTNPNDVAVTQTPDELHIWDAHSYELEPALELVRVKKPSLNEGTD